MGVPACWVAFIYLLLCDFTKVLLSFISMIQSIKKKMPLGIDSILPAVIKELNLKIMWNSFYVRNKNFHNDIKGKQRSDMAEGLYIREGQALSIQTIHHHLLLCLKCN